MQLRIDPNLSTQQIVAAFGLAGIAITLLVTTTAQANKIEKLKRHNRNLVVNNATTLYAAHLLNSAFIKSWSKLTAEQREALIPKLNADFDFETIVFQDKLFGTKK
jgi:histidinol-phosphate/aromatic aminotransferase/cobyric acid decarboxylase-like protein